MKRGLKSIRDFLVLAIIGFCLLITLYVSIPDYPSKAYAWEIMLWGEQSQWWSEVTWIALFGIFSISLIFLFSWNSELDMPRNTAFYRKMFLGIMTMIGVLLLFSFSATFFHWDGWTNTFALDRGGWLHGIFYLLTFLLGIVVFEEMLVLGDTVFHTKIQKAVT
jgi:hypothetical protein